MNLERYHITQAADNQALFEFMSLGPKGAVHKAVVFSEINPDNFYNLGFGDYDPLSNTIDDLAVTNNGDTTLILNTIAAIVFAFTEQNPQAMIFATGSTPARTRLYRMGLNSHLPELVQLFDLFGYWKDHWEPFVPGRDYEAFYVARKM